MNWGGLGSFVSEPGLATDLLAGTQFLAFDSCLFQHSQVSVKLFSL